MLDIAVLTLGAARDIVLILIGLGILLIIIDAIIHMWGGR